MDPQAGASFIPKKPLMAGAQQRRGAMGGIFLLLSLVVFIGSILLAGAVFGYQQYLKGLIQSRSASLDKAKAAYDPSVLENLIRLDNRFRQGQTILKSHVAPSSLFTFLENATLQQVRFVSFDYKEAGSGSASVTLKGEAPDFSTVALQSEAFGSSRVLKDILFSDLNVNDSGKVSFSVHAAVDPSFLLYSNYLAALVAAPVTPPSGTTPL